MWTNQQQPNLLSSFGQRKHPHNLGLTQMDCTPHFFFLWPRVLFFWFWLGAPRVLFTHTIFFIIDTFTNQWQHHLSHSRWSEIYGSKHLVSKTSFQVHKLVLNISSWLCIMQQNSILSNIIIFLVSFMAQTLKSLLLHERLVFSGMLTSKIKAQLTRLGLQLNYTKFDESVKFSPDVRSHFIKNFSPIKISAAGEIYCSLRTAQKQPLARFQDLHYCGLNSCRRRKSRIWLGECNPTLTAEFASVIGPVMHANVFM